MQALSFGVSPSLSTDGPICVDTQAMTIFKRTRGITTTAASETVAAAAQDTPQGPSSVGHPSAAQTQQVTPSPAAVFTLQKH